MPVFEFKCIHCECIFDELYSSFSEYENSDKNLICPECGLKAKHNKLIGSSMINFKGNGWTPNYSRNSTKSIQDKSIEIKEDTKNIKKSELYNTSLPKDIG